MQSRFQKCSHVFSLLSGLIIGAVPTCIAQLQVPEPDSCCRKEHLQGQELELRIAQAKQIIEESKQIIDDSRLFIAQAEKDIDNARRLEGQAREYGKKLDIKAPVLKGKQLQAARKQYSLDLAAFAEHSRKYKQHMLDIRKHFGQCQASLAAYEKMKKELSLHCDQFHMPDIEPPHICLEMGTSYQEAAGIQNKAREQALRLAQAQVDLQKEEARLLRSIAERGIVDGALMKQSELALREQALAAEFGRLKEEHRQLEVERKALSRSGVKVGVPSVKATIKKN